jgi:hypothetical protein
VDLQLIEDEVKALRLEKEVLKIKLAEAEDRIKILTEEVQWALNGYIRN